MSRESKVVEETVTKPGESKPTKVKVHIKLNSNGISNRVMITNTHDTPDFMACLLRLPSKLRRDAQTWVKTYGTMSIETLVWHTRESIPIDAWCKAIADATIRKMATSAVEAELETSKVLNDAYIAIDNQVYRLSCVGMTGTNKALSVVRKRAVTAAKEAGEAVIQAAQATADKMRQDGIKYYHDQVTKAKEIKSEAEKIAKNAKLVPPDWIVQNEVPTKVVGGRFGGTNLAVGLQCKININKFVFDQPHTSGGIKHKEWDAVRVPPVWTTLWCPINSDGTYNMTCIYTNFNMPHLPHVTISQSCFSAGDAPKYIKSYDDYIQLQSIVNRIMTEANLASLLTSIQYWPESVQLMVPTQAVPGPENVNLRDILSKEGFKTALRGVKGQRETVTNATQVAREESETWTVG